MKVSFSGLCGAAFYHRWILNVQTLGNNDQSYFVVQQGKESLAVWTHHIKQWCKLWLVFWVSFLLTVWKGGRRWPECLDSRVGHQEEELEFLDPGFCPSLIWDCCRYNISFFFKWEINQCSMYSYGSIEDEGRHCLWTGMEWSKTVLLSEKQTAKSMYILYNKGRRLSIFIQ